MKTYSLIKVNNKKVNNKTVHANSLKSASKKLFNEFIEKKYKQHKINFYVKCLEENKSYGPISAIKNQNGGIPPMTPNRRPAEQNPNMTVPYNNDNNNYFPTNEEKYNHYISKIKKSINIINSNPTYYQVVKNNLNSIKSYLNLIISNKFVLRNNNIYKSYNNNSNYTNANANANNLEILKQKYNSLLETIKQSIKDLIDSKKYLHKKNINNLINNIDLLIDYIDKIQKLSPQAPPTVPTVPYNNRPQPQSQSQSQSQSQPKKRGRNNNGNNRGNNNRNNSTTKKPRSNQGNSLQPHRLNYN